MTPEQSKEFLSLASSFDVLEELLGRFDHAVFAGLMARPTPGSEVEEENENDQVIMWRHIGNPYMCEGLACDLIAECQKERDAVRERIDPHDL